MPKVRQFRLALALATIVITALIPATASAAKVKSFKPAARAGSTLVFRVSGVNARQLKAVKLRVGRRSRHLSAGRVRAGLRHGGLVRARVLGGPRKARRFRHHARLVLAVAAAAPKQQPVRAAGASCTYGTFSAARQPGACWRPYGDASPFNRRLSSNPRVDPRSSAIVSRVTGWGKPEDLYSATDSKDDWTHAMFFAQASDPVYTIHCLRDWGKCEVEGMQVRIPRGARPAAGGDGHMAVMDQASGWEYDFWQSARPSGNGGTLNIAWGGRTRATGSDADGLGSDATAAHFGAAAGIIRAQEMQQGVINHALFMVVHCDSGKQVYPAQGLGSGCSGQSNAPAEGQRFFLDLNGAQINALKVPSWKKVILRAMATVRHVRRRHGLPLLGPDDRVRHELHLAGPERPDDELDEVRRRLRLARPPVPAAGRRRRLGQAPQGRRPLHRAGHLLSR